MTGIEKERKLFEAWLNMQFGPNITNRLLFDSKDGYADEIINAMWIGFNAGRVFA